MDSKSLLISEEFYLLYYNHTTADEIAYRNFWFEYESKE